jgi:hypothetical protein
MSVRSRLEGTPDLTRPVVTSVAPDGEQDPSMPGIPTVAAPTVSLAPVAAAPVAAPVVAPVAPVVPAELPELRYEWQPTDDMDKPIGGVQVILYRTDAEKFQKMQEKTVLLLRQLRKERVNKALGTPEERIDNAEQFQNVTEFKPRSLKPDEAFAISQGLMNPETCVAAQESLMEATFGVKPAVLASTLNKFTRREIQAQAVENYIEFVNTTGFLDTPENRTLVTGWLGTRNLAPTVANFSIAQTRLTEAGLLQTAPVVRPEPVNVPTPAVVVAPVAEEPKPQVPTTPQPALAAPELQAKRQGHVPSGLTPSVASPTASISSDTSVGGFSLTLVEIDKMSSDEYKRRLRDPKFAQYVNKLEADASAARRARANGQPQQ